MHPMCAAVAAPGARRLMAKRTGEIRLLAVASFGGHWEQLMLLRPALDGFRVTYATTDPALAQRDGLDVLMLPDANRGSPMQALRCLWQAFRIVFAIRPDFIISTGALPGLLCIVAGRLAGARTLWIDSVANSEHLSMSGRWAQRLATRVLTQWEHLAVPQRLYFEGRLL